jgi:hypothetical protein
MFKEFVSWEPKLRQTMKLLVFLSMLLLCSCNRTSENSSSRISVFDTPEGAAVEEKLKAYYTDMSNRDWKKYRQHFWDGATITTAWRQPADSLATVDITTIEDFIKETPRGPDSQPVFEERMKNSTIQVRGNLAEAWVDYDAKFGKEDSIAQWSGTDVFTFLRHRGEWKIVSLVFESK